VKLGTWQPGESPGASALNVGGLPLEACLIGPRAVLIFHPLRMEPKYLDVEDEPKLTSKQVELLLLLAEGNTIKECARVIGVSSRSVYNLLASVRKKLHAPSNMHALKIAGELGIVSPRRL